MRNYFSARHGVQSIDDEIGRRGDELRAFAEMLRQFRIGNQPPKRVPCKNQMRSATATEFLQIVNRLPAVARIAIVDSVLLQKMPAFASAVIKNGGVAAIGSDNQIIGCRDPLQFQAGSAKRRGGCLVKKP